jgi:ABC-type bacteriocin/lantibiotic exporter with double-glycine peptidase domain
MLPIHELSSPWLLILVGILLLVVDLLLGIFAFPLLRRRFRKKILRDAEEIEKESGARISAARMKVLEREFEARIKQEVNGAKIKQILAEQRKALKNIMQ